jgi:hypothetical protein
MWPSKAQWDRWSLPSKLTAIGTLVGIISLLFGLVVYFFPYGSFSESDSRKVLRTNSIQQLSDDLEKIKNLLPPNRVIAKCIESQGNVTYLEGYELCSAESKVNGSSAQSLIEKDISNFQAYFDEKEIRPVLQLLDKIYKNVYEMHNNSMVYGNWMAQSCPDIVSFGDEQLLEEEVRKNDSHPPKCLLVMMRNRSEIDRPIQSPPYSSLSTGYIDKSHFKDMIVIAPGGSKSLKEFFQASDSEMYSTIQDHIYTVKTLLTQLK